MKKIDFNTGWFCYRTGRREEAFEVTVPHDAMQYDRRSGTSPGGVNTGWYEANDYTYEKTFLVPAFYEKQVVELEFEGVYRKATIYLNGEKIKYHDYGYTGFCVDISGYVKYGAENVLRVEVKNSDQPNSRWYSGTGLYRPVFMYLRPEKHIVFEGVKLHTLNYESPRIKAEVRTRGMGTVKVEILDGEQVVCSRCMDTVSDGEQPSAGRCAVEIAMPDAVLWTPETPKLYTCRLTFGEDVQEERFGIRIVECTPEKGFCINGRRVILRGACIHHDNGLLGACAYESAERRKIRILKENGYNAVRSAHNPCSKAILRACDEMGMLLMDEYVDVWYIHKTKYDYASEVEQNYEGDLNAIVSKDYNHPSVIMYSIGNEVSETAQKKGISLCGKLVACLHRLDSSRPVTCGVNIFFNFLSSMGMGVYSDEKARQEVINVKKKKPVGSEFFNHLAGILGADFMKFGATLYPCDVKTRDAFEEMDIAGYNYGIKRYEKDLKKYPRRIILGSETFCSDVADFMSLAQKNKRIIGDFVWAGMDYLGEVGVGAWEYRDYAPRFDKGAGWVSAGSGRIDLTGKPLAEMKYTRVVFGLDKIGLGVIPVPYARQRHSPSAWKMSNAIESWSWNGCGGMKTIVEVYAKGRYVSLYVNGKLVSIKKTAKNYCTRFQTIYYDGEIKAVSYDADREKIAEITLKTAGEKTRLTLEPEKKFIQKNELCYIRMKYTDAEGIVKPLARGKIRVKTEGGQLIGCGSACPYYPGRYLDHIADTYYGEALAIVKPSGEEKIIITAESRFGKEAAEIEVIQK